MTLPFAWSRREAVSDHDLSHFHSVRRRVAANRGGNRQDKGRERYSGIAFKHADSYQTNSPD